MQFDSLTFLLFFAAVLATYYAVPNWGWRKNVLLASSYLFYMAWSPPLVILIWISTLADFCIAKRMHATTAPGRRKALVAASLVINLGVLSYFKYAAFLLGSFADLLALAGVAYRPPDFDIILPIGISFYTFQTLSYTLDVYRRKTTPEQSLRDFALFVTFFPQLVAGPIVRATHFLPQCAEAKPFNSQALTWGLALLVWGIFQKTVLADTIFAPLVDAFYADVTQTSVLGTTQALLAFSMQIYCDFAGYSLCAVGAALCLGFSIPDNFKAPYAAAGFSDFWRRWHVTLSTWLRDYLYVSLGGNRRGSTRTYVNLTLTMLLGGLWHGASWNFVVWGLLHGVLLMIERSVRRDDGAARLPVALSVVLTFLAVTLVWIPFRSPDWATTVAVARSFFASPLTSGADYSTASAVALATAAAMLVYHYYRRQKSLDDLMRSVPAGLQAAGLALATLSVALCATGDTNAFIYFQF